jgi:two-component system chemotaxis response regulator CheB
VLVVDDSAVIRGIWARIIDAEPDMRVVASAANGRAAVDVLRRRAIDVIVLDIEMPQMSGIEALPLLLSERPGVRVVMASSLTRKGAEITITALSLGAADYVTKPSAAERESMATVGKDLVRKIRALAGRAPVPVPAPAPSVAQPGRAPAPRVAPPPPFRPGHAMAPQVVGIASSTGGPNALGEVLAALPATFPLPILIVQHMPPLFTTMLAERLQRTGRRPCVEGKDGMEVLPGTTYIAPGDYHMTVKAEGGRILLRLDQAPAENFCRPSADPLLRSMAATYGDELLTVVLTGMGHDGLEGARAVAEAGGTVIAQDQATSVVWGMPGAVTNAGLAREVLPLAEIAPFIDEQARVRR